MSRSPSIITLSEAARLAAEGPRVSVNGGPYVPGRPEGTHTIGSRLRATWMVLKGEADALVGPDDQ